MTIGSYWVCHPLSFYFRQSLTDVTHCLEMEWYGPSSFLIWGNEFWEPIKQTIKEIEKEMAKT
jgi:hypothetical protein